LIAQVTFIIDTLPASTPVQDTVYIASDFNVWNPGASEQRMHRNIQGKWEITLPARPELTAIL